MLHENAIRVAKMRNSMRSVWRVLQHSSQSKAFPLPVLSQFSGHVPASAYPLKPNPVSAICPRCHAAFIDAAEAVSTDGSERADLIESIEGYTIPKTRRGIEWIREPTRPVGFGEGLRFRYA